MDTTKPAVTTPQTAAPVTEPAVVSTEDYEAKVTALEAEKARLIEEGANWKLAALKAKGKLKESPDAQETDDEKTRRIMREEIANSRLGQIDAEREALLKKALKENKELKLAQFNRTTTTPSGAIGTHSEGQKVQDTLITPEQLAAFKARGWDDKQIERYKKNLLRAGGGVSGR